MQVLSPILDCFCMQDYFVSLFMCLIGGKSIKRTFIQVINELKYSKIVTLFVNLRKSLFGSNRDFGISRNALIHKTR